MKKKLLIYITILFIGTFLSTAQKKGGNNYEKIKTLKVNFISSELNLSPEVAEKFWPIYNQYEEVNRQLRTSKIRKIKEDVKKNGAIGDLSDEKAKELSKKFIKLSDRYASNKRKCFEQLEPVLSPQQLLQLHFAEIEFNFKVLRKLHKEKQNNNK